MTSEGIYYFYISDFFCLFQNGYHLVGLRKTLKILTTGNWTKGSKGFMQRFGMQRDKTTASLPLLVCEHPLTGT